LDYLVICDRSGQKCLRSECVKEWTGFIVKREFADRRHPLDFQKPSPKESVPEDVRPIKDHQLAYGEVKPGDL
jgi:hypothetical protein